MQVQRRSDNSKNKNGWIGRVILIVVWFLIFSLIRDLWQIKNGFTRVEESKRKLAEVESANSELKEKLSLVSTSEYTEKLIREQLNMQKVGEVVAVLPKKEITKNSEENTEMKEVPNWEKWWALVK